MKALYLRVVRYKAEIISTFDQVKLHLERTLSVLKINTVNSVYQPVDGMSVVLSSILRN
jgi:hypothetical protein